jgi:hypothetical protein
MTYGRKFIMASIILVLEFVLFYTGRIDQKAWEAITTSIFGIFVLGNIVEKFTNEYERN